MEDGVDLVLSGGFLAFAEQAGFLKAVEDVDLPVAAVCGTSSGALAGSLWTAGMPAFEILRRLTDRSPLRQLRPSLRPWRGLLSLRPVIRELSADLPSTIDDLERPFAVGVIDPAWTPSLLTQGPLPEAVAASCAIPRLFGPVSIGDACWADGAMVDRSAFGPWRAHRGPRPTVLHWVESGKEGAEPEVDEQTTVIRTPAAGASFWDLGDVHARFDRTRRSSRAVLEEL